jgi:hypothetical protein
MMNMTGMGWERKRRSGKELTERYFGGRGQGSSSASGDLTSDRRSRLEVAVNVCKPVKRETEK